MTAPRSGLALLSDFASLEEVPPAYRILPLTPDVRAPRDRLAATGPEDLLGVADIPSMERDEGRLAAAWTWPDRVRWAGVDLGTCFRHDSRYVVRDLVKTAYVVARALRTSGEVGVATDLGARTGEFPPYPYLHALGPVLEAAANREGVPFRRLGRGPVAAPQRGGRAREAYASVASRAGRGRLQRDDVLLAFGPYAVFYRSVAKAWRRSGRSMLVVSPQRSPVRAAPREGLYYASLESLEPSEGRGERRSFVTEALGTFREVSVATPAVVEGLDLAEPLRTHILSRLEAVLPDLVRIGSVFERLPDRVRGLLLTETTSPAAVAAVAASRRAGIPTVVLQHGVIAGEEEYRRVDGDRVAAWGPADAEWFRGELGPRTEVAATGCTKYDPLAPPRPGARRAKRTPVVMLASQPFVPQGPMDSPRDRALLLRMVSQAARQVAGAEFLVKWHPSESPSPEPLQDGGGAFREVWRSDTPKLLRSVDVLLAISSTVALEGMYLGLPVVFLGPADPKNRFRPPEVGAGVRAETAGDLSRTIRSLLSDEGYRERVLAGQREWLSRSFAPLDGRAGERVVELVGA